MGKRNHLSTGQLLNEALKHHQAGRLGEAAAGYQEILLQNPKHSDALHLLGVIGQQMDKLEMAIGLMKAAIAQNPSVAHYHHNLGNTYLKNRQAAEAVSCYRQAILLKPDYFEAHFGMGNALAELDQFVVAAEAYQMTVTLQPSFAEAHYNLGRMLGKLDKFEAAIASYRSAIQFDSNRPEYFFNLGGLLLNKGEYTEAFVVYKRAFSLTLDDSEGLNSAGLAFAVHGKMEEAEYFYRQALRHKPNYASCYNNLGKVLAARHQYSDAIACYKHAIDLDPQYAIAYFNLGVLQQELQNSGEAEELFRVAVAIAPDLLEAHYNLGNILRSDFRLGQAIECYRKVIQSKQLSQQDRANKHVSDPLYLQTMGNLALASSETGDAEAAIALYKEALTLDPENVTIRTNLAYLFLSLGRLEEGLIEHEWRWKKPEAGKLRDFNCPLWKGEPLQGKRILIHAEQGFGDTLQFVRYVPLVAQRGGKVILEVPRALHKLLSQISQAEQVISAGDPLPEVEWHCPLMSLPLAFGTTLETIPFYTSYLSIPQDEISSVKQRWPGEGLRVGLAWSGNPNHKADAYRSTSLEQFIPLGTISGVSFYSLQVGPASKQIAEVASSFTVIDVCSGFTDFADTATFVAGLDLVIAVDTSVVHLAGALGIPVWILIASCRSDWRWFSNRSDSPWYPSARLFRQEKPGDWAGLMERVRLELSALVSEYAVAAGARMLVS